MGSRGRRMLSLGLYLASRVDVGTQRAAHRARRAADAARHALGGFLVEALTVEERSDVGIEVYDLSFRALARELFPWERRWFALRLPPPPATLLVGAAGDGREVRALCARGYRVDAFEPAARPAERCRRTVGDRGEVARARYEDLTASVLDGAAGPAAAFARRRYDAVLLGWGSLMHVLAPDERRRVVTACARLTPEGPILASFGLAEPRTADAERHRAFRTGRRLGAAVRRLRGIAAASTPAGFAGTFGFTHALTRAEVEQLAAGAGRRLVWEALGQDGPHVTFLPA